MAAEDREYVITSLECERCESEILTVELPSREIVAQLEVPRAFVERVAELGDSHGISPEQVLGERLEINRAKTELQAARTVEEVSEVRDHLVDAKGYLAGVEFLDTAEFEREIERVWANQLDSQA